MASLSDQIEEYLNELIGHDEGQIEIKRNQLADEFDCAPSQINYVLNTRFTPEKGYVVESQRGGGGFIRIIKVSIDSVDESLRKLITRLNQPISQQDAQDIIHRLHENDLIDKREKYIMDMVTHRQVLGIELPERDYLRSRIMQSMLEVILKTEKGEE
ncbi:CtsR family transcriptional regulator [Halarsenatibacter silvermanii]|uniref:Transcriptional regulator CtsR n=1 Tax=Halarsenatibacter silvermanii TaxID=321763 RepID=A0A1G9SX76_9FIRM|nr:CtsR family transcriptional regulator [Halarsenatibacter silvermanii]SDM39947.1 transcriptional regulator CtsR [Halarsenatibacter silvermanii]